MTVIVNECSLSVSTYYYCIYFVIKLLNYVYLVTSLRFIK